MFVHEMKKSLDQLEPEDRLIPDQVQNLAIRREGQHGIGSVIDFYFNLVECSDDLDDAYSDFEEDRL